MTKSMQAKDRETTSKVVDFSLTQEAKRAKHFAMSKSQLKVMTVGKMQRYQLMVNG